MFDAQPDMSVHTHVVPIEPMGKPRMTQRDKWKKRPCVVKYRQWCDAIRKEVGTVVAADKVVRVFVRAYFQPPTYWSKKRREAALGTLHRQKPDFDNVLKGVVDALWRDDSKIPGGGAIKLWDTHPRVEIDVEFGQLWKAA